jgi:hypothetical protein
LEPKVLLDENRYDPKEWSFAETPKFWNRRFQKKRRGNTTKRRAGASGDGSEGTFEKKKTSNRRGFFLRKKKRSGITTLSAEQAGSAPS